MASVLFDNHACLNWSYEWGMAILRLHYEGGGELGAAKRSSPPRSELNDGYSIYVCNDAYRSTP